MAQKSFSKIILFCFILSACSSVSSQKRHGTNELEKRADDYFFLADRFRLQGRINDALEYYHLAGEIYFKKWLPNKYVLAGIKECIVILNQGQTQEAEKRFYIYKNFENSLGIPEVQPDLALLEAMILYAEGKKELGTTLLDSWIDRRDIPGEKKDYMLFYRLWKTQTLPKNFEQSEIQKKANSIITRYWSGELENPEIAFFTSLAMAEFLEKNNNDNEAWNFLKQVVDIHRESEVTIQWPRIFATLSRVAKKLNKQDLSNFYQELEQKQAQLELP